MFDRDLDDLVSGEIGSDRGILPALANDVGFVGLCCGQRVSNDLRSAYSACACSDDPHNCLVSRARVESRKADLKTAIVCSESSWAWKSQLLLQ